MMVVDMEHELVDDELEELSAAAKAAKRVKRIEDESIASVTWDSMDAFSDKEKKQEEASVRMGKEFGSDGSG